MVNLLASMQRQLAVGARLAAVALDERLGGDEHALAARRAHHRSDGAVAITAARRIEAVGRGADDEDQLARGQARAAPARGGVLDLERVELVDEEHALVGLDPHPLSRRAHDIEGAHGDGAAGISHREAAQAVGRSGHLTDAAIVARGIDAGRAAIVGQEVDGARIAAPLRVADIAIERAGQHFGAAAIGIGDVEFGCDITLRLRLTRDPGDAAAIGRGHGFHVGAGMTGDLAA